MRAFVTIRKLITNPPADKITELRQEITNLKEYMEEVITDQNDINEDTRVQLELINQTLAEFQVQKRITGRPCRPIGFIKPEE